jgi:double-stranded uracil-DNA glycosylase
VTGGGNATGFPPVSDAAARVLILGSMPGEASLRAQQYYAHPRNGFWPIVGELLGFPLAETGYDERCRRLRHAGIAVWDVLAACTRRGSLDTAIVSSSMVVNDFAAFFSDHPDIGRVYFNGGLAERVYRRRVLPALPPRAADLTLCRMPSTSPANASLTLAQKTAAWREMLTAGR